jgi:hypothetical protein
LKPNNRGEMASKPFRTWWSSPYKAQNSVIKIIPQSL